jgi:predicted dehydrogenase
MDHWYIALGELAAARESDRVEVVAIGHRDGTKAEATARHFGVPEWTTDYPGLVERLDVDIVVTAAPTAENPELCRVAAAGGKHILSVKPIAMTLADARSVARAVRDAGVQFMSWESCWRLTPVYRQMQSWIAEGRIGPVISALAVMRAPLPTTPWPGERGPTWWLDAAKAPGGGWLDHAIYHVDFLRWLLNDDVARVGGEVANLKYPDLPFEDYGAANLTFAGGSRAISEVTWTGPAAGALSQVQITGRDGQIVYDPSIIGKLALAGRFADAGGPGGWLMGAAPGGTVSVLDHLAAAVQGGTPTIAAVDDAVTNLRVALAFYDAARTGQTITLSDGSCA